jgi:NTE family protein
VILKNPGSFEPVPGADLNGDPSYTATLHLADGGVYDNLGLETVWNRCATVLVSDAGAPFATSPKPERDWVRQTMRALDVATDQSRALRKRALITDFSQSARAGGYRGIDTNISNYGLADAMSCSPSRTSPLAAIRTRLDPFSDEEQGQLINWGYALADAAIRRHAPQLIQATVEARWPVPAFSLD